MIQFPHITRKTLFAITAAVALTACDSDTSGTGSVTGDADLIVRNAAKHVSKNAGVNLTDMQTIVEGSSVVSTLAKRGKSSSLATDSYSKDYEDSIYNLVLPTLTGGNSTTEQNGNTIVLSDLSVRIDASSDDTGRLTYLFGGETVLEIQYAPASAAYEFFLSGFNRMVQRAADISGDQSDLPDTMQGALKLTTSINNTANGTEAGRMSLAISQALRLSSSIENYSLTAGMSTLFDVRSDTNTGVISASVAINALKISAAGLLGSEPDAVTNIDLPEFSGTAKLTRSGTEILLSNFGLGRGPLTIDVDSNQVVRLELPKLTAKYNDLTETLEFSQRLALNAVINYSRAAFGWFADDSRQELSVTAPTGTTLQRQLNDSVKIESGGPFNYRYSYTSNDKNFEQNASFQLGECFEEDNNSDELIVVSCD